MPSRPRGHTLEVESSEEEVNRMRRIVIGLLGLVAVLALVGALARSPGSSGTTTPAGSPTRVYSDDVLSRAGAMTQQMSAPGPLTGHEYHLHGGDEQLRLSSDAEFVRELEAYQAQIDKMLARTP